jgi:hypothetical protein
VILLSKVRLSPSDRLNRLTLSCRTMPLQRPRLRPGGRLLPGGVGLLGGNVEIRVHTLLSEHFVSQTSNATWSETAQGRERVISPGPPSRSVPIKNLSLGDIERCAKRNCLAKLSVMFISMHSMDEGELHVNIAPPMQSATRAPL